MADVFISCTRDDREAVERLALGLQRMGLSVWCEPGADSGQPLSDEAAAQARAARAVVVCWSPSGVGSPWVSAGAAIGAEQNKLVSARAAGEDAIAPPAPFNAAEAVDLRAWIQEPDDDSDAWRGVLKRTAGLCGRADVQDWCDLTEKTPLAGIRAWLEAHRDSPLATGVDIMLRRREAENIRLKREMDRERREATKAQEQLAEETARVERDRDVGKFLAALDRRWYAAAAAGVIGIVALLAFLLTSVDRGGVMAEIEKAERQEAAQIAERREPPVTLASGVEVQFQQRGPDQTMPRPGPEAVVLVHYEGSLVSDGSVFDSSFQRDQPAEFPLNAVVPGFSEAIQQMRPGDEIVTTFPAALGYGAEGRPPVIPPNSALRFRIRLLAFQAQDGSIVGHP